MEVCTIIAKNYLAHARVLARSLAEHNPGSRLWTLIIDDFAGYVDPANEPFEVLTPADVGCRPFDYMALRYTVLELSTAVKPWLLRHLMGHTGRPVTYLDPDIKVYGSLERLDDLAAEHGVVVIPHNNEPLPPDGHKPSQVDVMIAGVYNLGYVSLSDRPEVDQLIDWWGDRLRRDCRVDPIWGYFVDQRWFDLVPGFLTDFAIVRDPEYNVAYWNLHNRRLEQNGGGYLVDGRPLAFFHFSGFDPMQPLSLSRHQDRINVAQHPVLERLLSEYADEVMAEGHGLSCRWPYTYTALGDGTEIDELIRDLGAQFEDELEELGEEVPSLFTLAGARNFQAWLAEDAAGAPPGVNRVLARVYNDRPDLQREFPDVQGSDRERLLSWAHDLGSREIPLLARAAEAFGESSGNGAARKVPATARPGQVTDPLGDEPWGVNLVGYLGYPGDLGEVARQLLGALDASGVPVAPVQEFFSPSAPEPAPFPTVAKDAAPYLVNLLATAPERLTELAASAGHRFFASRYSIAVWHAETCPPEPALELLQEIWAPSQHVAAQLAGRVQLPVMVLPLAVAPPAFPVPSRRQAGLAEDRWLFLAAVDREDQDPSQLIDAFKRAFPGDDAAALTIMYAPGAGQPSVEELRRLVGESEAIQVIDLPASRAERLGLTALCDAYVSLHGSVPFGMPLAEAMWLGKPVVATGYSGNLEFMTAENSLLVAYDLADGRAAANTEHAASLMRELFRDPASARALGQRAASDIRRTNSIEAAGAAASARLGAIRAGGEVPRWLSRRVPRPAALAHAHNSVTHGPPATPRVGRGSRARGAVRSALLRFLRPYTSYQQRVNAVLVEAVREVHETIDQQREQVSAERAQLLAELRGSRQLRAAVEVQARGLDELKRTIGLQNDRGLYLALSRLAERHSLIGPAPGESQGPRDLSGFELRGYSQNGEDGVLAEILRRVGAPTQFFVEFGIESGVEGNCVYLSDVARWSGLFMEADDQMYRMLERKYAPHPGVRTQQALVTPENIEDLLRAGEVPLEPDVVSIDVDGSDYWVWEAIEQYRPRVLIIEYNSALDPHRRLVQPKDAGAWDGTDYFGASLGAIRSLGERKGYRLVHTELAGSNAFLVREDLVEDRFPEPDAVPVRGVPNYFQTGYRHPADELQRRYLDLDTGELVSIR